MMFRGRTPRSIQKLNRAVACVAESLETRRLLTTLSTIDTDLPSTFDYIDAENNLNHIELSGNITAEFVGLNVRNNGTQVIRDLFAPPPGDLPDGFRGVNLFNIYISESDGTGSITITNYTQPDNAPRVYHPYDGSAGPLLLDINAAPPADLSEDYGSVYIGARTPEPEDGDVYGIPILFNRYRAAVGVRPATRGIYAGIQTAEGVSVNKIMIGGFVTGLVQMQGNVDTFYAGALFTGNLNAPELTNNNFFIGGSLRHLVVKGDIGTTELDDVNYTSEFDARIGGKVGDTFIGGNYDGGFKIVNATLVPGFTTQMTESESDSSFIPDAAFVQGELNLTVARNDTVTNPQFLYTDRSERLAKSNVVDLSGSVNLTTDPADYYGLPLLAGQKVSFVISSDLAAFADWELIDPDNRRIDSSDSDFNPDDKVPPTGGSRLAGPRTNISYTFTADRPGVYKIGVLPGTALATDYSLIVTGAGDIALGSLRTVGSLAITNADSGVSLLHGDLGAIYTDLWFRSASTAGLRIEKGNLRSIVAGEIDFGQQLYVPRGSVGLIDATDVLGSGISGNTDAGTLYDNYSVDEASNYAIGGDYQVIRSIGGISANFVARGNIGTIVCTKPLPNLLSPDGIASEVIVVNADGIGSVGKIDLLDSNLDFGTATFGGPAIYTGPGGNVRYMRIRETIYNDRFFGTGSTTQTLAEGLSVTRVDDSGARALIVPTNVVTEPANGTTPATVVKGALSITTYGVREKGGSIIARLDSTTGVTITSSGSTAEVDIGELRSSFTEADSLTFDETLRKIGYVKTVNNVDTISTVPTIPLDIVLRGDAPINVYDITTTTGAVYGNELSTSSVGDLDFSKITNSTSGEILCVYANSVGYLYAERIGMPVTQATPATLMGLDLAFPLDEFPFSKPSIMVRANNFLDIQSRTYMGNIASFGAVGQTGFIGNLRANSDNSNVKRTFEGINGPVVADWIQKVHIGEGVLSSGNGDVVKAGLFATGFYGRLGPIIADNAAQIRGDIVAGTFIDSITLNNGSIIDADIATNEPNITTESTSALGRASETLVTTTDRSLTFPEPLYNIGAITLNGTGGILGSTISTGHFGPITISGGFGIVNSAITSLSNQKVSSSITTSGVGIRNSVINPGQSMDNIVMTDLSGATLNLSQYSPFALQSAITKYDAFSGFGFSQVNDLYIALGVSSRNPAKTGVTTAGVIEDTPITGSNSINTIRAYEIRATDTSTTSFDSPQFPSRIVFADSIKSIEVNTRVNGLQVTTGNLANMAVGGEVRNTKISTAGAIGTLSARHVRDSVTIQTSGPNGTIGSILIKGNFTPYQLIASRNIGTIAVNGSLSTNVNSQFGLRAPNITSLIVDGDMATGTFVRATGKISRLVVGGDVQTGAKILAGSYGTRTVNGTIFGQVAIG